MDQAKIGRFIAEQRKKQNLTQMQLAEKLNITDRAVSKWERGKAMPDSSIMLGLCDILKITVNDLLCGEIVKMENYKEELENNLIEMARQKERTDKRLLTLEIIIGISSFVTLIALCIIAAYASMSDAIRILLCCVGVAQMLVIAILMLRIEQVAGYYECKHCHEKHIPSYRQMLFSMHMGRTRYIRCPKCQKKSWQKKVISKE